jgi:hypothetical protein
MTVTIGRRELLAAVGGAAAVWPFAVAAQPAIPVIGFLDATTPVETVYRVSGFRDGLKEAGFIDGHNVAIEFRWAENKLELVLRARPGGGLPLLGGPRRPQRKPRAHTSSRRFERK